MQNSFLRMNPTVIHLHLFKQYVFNAAVCMFWTWKNICNWLKIVSGLCAEKNHFRIFVKTYQKQYIYLTYLLQYIHNKYDKNTETLEVSVYGFIMKKIPLIIYIFQPPPIIH